MAVRFLVIPGWVFSRNDGDKHWVSIGDLMKLHHVNPDECLVFNEMWDVYRVGDPLTILSPSSSGEYINYGEES